jgi:hypothetical protein
MPRSSLFRERFFSLAAFVSIAFALLGARDLRAQSYCPPQAYNPTTFAIERYDGSGTVSFRPWYFKYTAYGNFYTPSPVAKANQYGRIWKWQNAYIGVLYCDSYQAPNGSTVHIVHFDAGNVSGYAMPVSGYCDDDDDGWGGQLRAVPTGPEGGEASVLASGEANVLSSCDSGGGSPSDPESPGPNGGGGTCIPPGCYSVYVDGAYVGSACFDVQLCFRF